MDTETRITVCKRKLDEKEEELERETKVRAKKRKEKETDADTLENEIIRDQDKIIEMKDEIKKLQDAIINLQKSISRKTVDLELRKEEIQTYEEETDKEVSMIKQEVQFYRTMMNDMTFIDDIIKEKEQELKCPVCFEIASVPIFMCQDSHLICGKCMPKLSVCPECREEYPRPPKRHRYAEKIVDELQRLRAKRSFQEADAEKGLVNIRCVYISCLNDSNVYHDDVYFKLKKTAKIGAIMKLYSARVGIPFIELRFMVDGRRIHYDETLESLEMEDNDDIDVLSWSF